MISRGDKYTFTARNGTVRNYTVVKPDEDMEPAVQRQLGARWEDMTKNPSIVYLKNEAGDDYAMVTVHWLLGGTDAGGVWERAA